MDNLLAVLLHSSTSGIDPLLVIVAVGTLCAKILSHRWTQLSQWFHSLHSESWPTLPALVDIVSVVALTEETKYGERTYGYQATLTYFYRNPELQCGEYSRTFDAEDKAAAWAESYKGSSVTVHVDPKDPSRSVLLKDDL